MLSKREIHLDLGFLNYEAEVKMEFNIEKQLQTSMKLRRLVPLLNENGELKDF